MSCFLCACKSALSDDCNNANSKQAEIRKGTGRGCQLQRGCWCPNSPDPRGRESRRAETEPMRLTGSVDYIQADHQIAPLPNGTYSAEEFLFNPQSHYCFTVTYSTLRPSQDLHRTRIIPNNVRR